MKNLQGQLNRLTACILADIEAQQRSLDLLERLERSVLAESSDEVEQAKLELEVELATAMDRNAKRSEVIAGLALQWGVPVEAVTLMSIAERSGDGSQLLALRADLRALTSKVVKKSRHVSALLGLHRSVVREVIEFLAGGDESSPFRGEGQLINAEA